MGEITVFTCDACGYESGAIRWGAGSEDPRQRFLPALCRLCHNIVEVNLTGRDVLIETFNCETCGEPVHFFQRSDTFICPRCGEPDMRVLQKDYW